MTYPDIVNPKLLSDLYVSVLYVQKILFSINYNKTSGSDQLPPRIFRDFAEELSTPLAHFFSSLLKSDLMSCQVSGKLATLLPCTKVTKWNWWKTTHLTLSLKVKDSNRTDRLLFGTLYWEGADEAAGGRTKTQRGREGLPEIKRPSETCNAEYEAQTRDRKGTRWGINY